MLKAAITVDIDTLASNYKGFGLKRENYSYAEFRIGMENLLRFFGSYKIKPTLFIVGDDLRQPQNIEPIKEAIVAGCEIANHTDHHLQGFRLLSVSEKEAELRGMEEICEEVIGRKPVGFRSPGWNQSDDCLPILMRRGYKYDSSVFPSSLNPLLKVLHWRSMRARPKPDRTTLGQLDYMASHTFPFRTTESSFKKHGEAEFVEFPMTVVPACRLPFFSTFHMATGFTFFKASYEIVKRAGVPIQYLFHLSDFVDYTIPEFEDQIPTSGNYVPQALKAPLDRKLKLFRRIMDTFIADYSFSTLEDWATTILQENELSVSL